MRRSYGYTPGRQNSGWDTTSGDYHSHLSKMERMPTMIPDAPQYPVVHRAFNHKFNFEEEVELLDEHQDQGKQHRSPGSQKHVHVAEHVETIKEERDGSFEVYEENNVNVEADGYIHQKRKGFELCKWKTFKAH